MDRRSNILDLVGQTGRVNVNDLAGRMGVSQVTIRKDLDLLERQGLIRREHGYAEAVSPDNLISRLAVHLDVKRRIAQEAAKLVTDGETVMIESGSCCALLAAELAASRRVSIVTNSAFIADYVRNGTAQVVLLGGDYQPESQVTVGPLNAQCAQAYHAPWLFIGIDGYADGQFSGKDMARAAAVRVMAARCDQTVVLSEGSKFTRPGTVSLLPASAVSRVVTDDSLSVITELELQAASVKVHLVGAT